MVLTAVPVVYAGFFFPYKLLGLVLKDGAMLQALSIDCDRTHGDALYAVDDSEWKFSGVARWLRQHDIQLGTLCLFNAAFPLETTCYPTFAFNDPTFTALVLENFEEAYNVQGGFFFEDVDDEDSEEYRVFARQATLEQDSELELPATVKSLHCPVGGLAVQGLEQLEVRSQDCHFIIVAHCSGFRHCLWRPFLHSTFWP